jgi:hypothetical protein
MPAGNSAQPPLKKTAAVRETLCTIADEHGRTCLALEDLVRWTCPGGEGAFRHRIDIPLYLQKRRKR